MPPSEDSTLGFLESSHRNGVEGVVDRLQRPAKAPDRKTSPLIVTAKSTKRLE
jgi:hypothetical protein